MIPVGQSSRGDYQSSQSGVGNERIRACPCCRGFLHKHTEYRVKRARMGTVSARVLARTAPLLLLVGAVAAGENLLVNPGFEQLDGGMPAGWHCFVMPQPGSEGRLDDQAEAGRFAAMLRTPKPYDKDPVNNWSQNVIARVGGKNLRLRGSIKTDDATEAALWLQCWSRPWRLRHLATTSIEMPMYGTRDWTPVSMTVEAPKDTDFVVVRCVLLGTGAAWFDSLVLEDADEPVQEEEAQETGEGAADTDGNEAGGTAAAETLLEASAMLNETVRELRETNEALAEQLWVLYEEVQDLREQVGAEAVAPAPAPEVPAKDAPAPVPPLVPHGYDLEVGR